MNTIREFSKNSNGKDYVVGDIHGEYDNLIYQLNNVLNFDYENDRLFCVGDLIDRGYQNIECLGLLNEKWFFSCIGNHEIMLMNTYYNNDYKSYVDDWFLKLSNKERKNVCELIEDKMYLLMEVDSINNKKIGIIHAECINENWNKLKFYINNLTGKLTDHLNDGILDSALWGRKRFYSYDTSIINNIYKIIVGHTIVQKKTILKNGIQYKENSPFYFGNTLFLDTGATYKYQILNAIEEYKNRMKSIKKNSNLTIKDSHSLEEYQKKIFALENMMKENSYSLSFYDINNDKIIKTKHIV